MTVQEALQNTRLELEKIYDAGEADAIANWLLEWISGLGRQQRMLQQKTALTEEQITQWREALARLLKGEPVQYVTGQTWFCGLPFFVNQDVLIPRPETEELVEWVISQCRFPIQQLDILDVGTGSGCIAIALKKRLSKAGIVACDISPDALQVARRNAENLQLPVHFQELDFLDTNQRETLPAFDFVVSNPPYIPEQDSDLLEKNVTEHEPATALFVPNHDPLVFYQALAHFGQRHLKEKGMILMEIHAPLASNCVQLFEANGYQTEVKKDMQGKDRMLRAWK
ncbi:MAG: peptide chain release factor N(5)-glutamine methyltransferase [Chitinophagaceae bacterium]